MELNRPGFFIQMEMAPVKNARGNKFIMETAAPFFAFFFDQRVPFVIVEIRPVAREKFRGGRRGGPKRKMKKCHFKKVIRVPL